MSPVLGANSSPLAAVAVLLLAAAADASIAGGYFGALVVDGRPLHLSASSSRAGPCRCSGLTKSPNTQNEYSLHNVSQKLL